MWQPRYAFEVEHLKNKVLRKTALKFLQLSASNVNKVVMVTRWVYISLHRTETEGRIELWFTTFKRGGFPLSETFKIAKWYFWPNLGKIAVSPKLKPQKWDLFRRTYTYMDPVNCKIEILPTITTFVHWSLSRGLWSGTISGCYGINYKSERVLCIDYHYNKK